MGLILLSNYLAARLNEAEATCGAAVIFGKGIWPVNALLLSLRFHPDPRT
jgi:hypothetical protein